MNRPMNQIIQFNWMDVAEPGISCHDLHHDTSCLYEYFYKMANTMKRSAKLYFVLHFVSFLVFRLRKIKDRKKLKEALMKLVKMYFGSMLFLSSFVANTKLSLCINSYLCGDQPVFDGKIFWWGSFLISLSIFFQSEGRRQEIVYFIAIRALRSCYDAMKRRKWVNIPNEEKTAFVLIFGIISYIYHERKELLKHTNIYEALWAQA